jgi:hypothetical protein
VKPWFSWYQAVLKLHGRPFSSFQRQGLHSFLAVDMFTICIKNLNNLITILMIFPGIVCRFTDFRIAPLIHVQKLGLVFFIPHKIIIWIIVVVFIFGFKWPAFIPELSFIDIVISKLDCPIQLQKCKSDFLQHWSRPLKAELQIFKIRTMSNQVVRVK